MKLKPASFSKLAYENAQMYTNTLLDVYMDYKNVCKKPRNLLPEPDPADRVLLGRFPASQEN